jgi:hypothetical protein
VFFIIIPQNKFRNAVYPSLGSSSNPPDQTGGYQIQRDRLAFTTDILNKGDISSAITLARSEIPTLDGNQISDVVFDQVFNDTGGYGTLGD